MDPDPLKAIFRGLSSCSGSKRKQEPGEGSQDLFSSQSSTQLQDGIDITLQLTENIWVQCDNPDCQKWRKVPAGSFNNADDVSWFCSMNPDPKTNRCSAEEEDYAQYDRMARKAGIKFVMSMLQTGALVWAKMTGYCSWPAVVTLDPDLGVSVWQDIDGDPCSYHVEFLGNPHTHSWVAAKCIDVYGHKQIQTGIDSDSQKTPAHKQKKVARNKGRKFSKGGQGIKRQHFKSSHIDTVVAEADYLMRLEPQERLQYCIFKSKPGKPLENFATEKKKKSDKCNTCGQHMKLRTGKTRCVRTKRQAQQSCHTKRRSCELEDKNCSRPESEHSMDISADEGISVPTVKSEQDSVYGFDSPDQLSQSNLKFKNPLNNKTKEEKFTIDINMYRKNEQAFEHDVRRFMTRNGLKIRSSPLWHNAPVRIFQLFLAVYERGGYDKVTQKKQWTAVYREITEQHQVTTGSVAKHYYQRNLLPYELYIKGRDYTTALIGRYRQKKTKTVPKRNITKPVELSENKKEALPAVETSKPTEKMDLNDSKMFDDSQSKSTSQDINQLLGQLGEDIEAVVLQPNVLAPVGWMTEFTHYSSVQSGEKSKAAIGVKFHDDSTESSGIKYGNAASEFQETAKSVDRKATCCEMSLDDVQDKILHEMRALEDDLKEMDNELENL